MVSSSPLNTCSVFLVGGLGPLQCRPQLGGAVAAVIWSRNPQLEDVLPGQMSSNTAPPPPHSLQGSRSQATHSDVVSVDVVSVFLALCPA